MHGRVALAFVIAPGIIPAGVYLYAQTTMTSAGFARVGIVYSLVFVVSYALAVLVGMPMHRFMQTHQHRLLRHYELGGAIIGLIPGFVLFLPGRPAMSLTGSLIGAVSAAAFWLIGICDFAWWRRLIRQRTT